MKNQTVISMLLVCGLATACSSAPAPKKVTLVEAKPTATPAQMPAPTVLAIPYAQPVPGQAKPYQMAAPEDGSLDKDKAKPVDKVIDEANASAALSPVEEGYFNAIQTYDYMPGALYQVYGAPNHLTMITFAPGEELMSYAAGDTIRWIVAETRSGQAQGARAHLLVQPVRKSLHTTMIVTTNVGVYQFELKSFQHTFMAGVQFRYPLAQVQQVKMQLAASHQAQVQQEEADAARLQVPLEAIEDRYTLVVEDKDELPRWAPKRIFHDSKRTFIEFGRALEEQAIPSLFLLGADKNAEVVQFTVRGRYMIVPRVIEVGMLKRGKHESVGFELAQGAHR